MALVKPKLAAVEPTATVTDLLSRLRSTKAADRNAAALALSGNHEAVDGLLQALDVEASRAVRETILTSLARIGTRPVLERLLELLRSEQTDLRNGAAEVLQTTGSGGSKLIKELLDDDDSDVRIFAATILGFLAEPDASLWLVDVLRNEAHVNVVSAAIEALAEIGDPQSLEALSAVPGRFPDDPFIGFAAEVAITRIQPLDEGL